jgi:hypothetical protein
MTSAPTLEDRVRAALDPHLLVVRGIGTGGMGAVFLAREPALKRTVAVKVLAPDLAATPAARARFEREAQAVAGLSHPNIVNVHGVGELDDGTPYFVMQYVSGRSLSTRLTDDGPLPVAEARRILGEVASALATAHAKGIIHRDIKPANILCDEESGRTLVSDFGIAAVAPEGGTPDTRLTQTGMLVGTPQYMSPEQLLSEPPSEKTDMYALGLLGYEMLAGEAPFHGTTPHELIAAHLRDTPRKLSDVRDEVDAETESIVAACLSKQADQRPTAAEVAQRLAPGAGALLEWPPPGLERLHGAVRALVRWAAIGSAALLAAAVPLLVAGTVIASAASSAFTLLLFMLALAGLAFLFASARTALRIGVEAARAVRGGFGWLTVLEVLLDRSGDTGQLITGAGRFAPLAPERRGLLRKARMLREAGYLLAALLPLPLLMLVVLLGSSGLAGRAATWLAVLVPILLLVATGRLALLERKAVERRIAKRGGAGPRPDPARFAEPWYRTFDAVSRSQALGRGPAGPPLLGRVVALGLGGVTLLLALLALPIVLAGVFGPMLWSLSLPAFANTQEKLRLAGAARPWKVATDSTITPAAAGRAYAILMSRHAQEGPMLQPVPRRGPVPWDENLPEHLFPTARPKGYLGPDNQQILLAARRGFTREELAYLGRVAHADVWPYVSIVARAPALDALGGRYVTPFPPTANSYTLPIPHFANTKAIAYAASARAAWHLAQGRRDSAEIVLREMLSFGFALTETPFLIETLIGVVIVNVARANLEQLWTITGDPRAARLRALHDSALAARDARDASTAIKTQRFLGAAAMRQVTVAGATDSHNIRSLRFSMLHNLGMASCTNASELVFGPAPDVRDAFARARREVARFPSEQSLLDVMETEAVRLRYWPIEGALDGGLARVGRAGGALLGNDRLPGCVRLIRFLVSQL